MEGAANGRGLCVCVAHWRRLAVGCDGGGADTASPAPLPPLQQRTRPRRLPVRILWPLLLGVAAAVGLPCPHLSTRSPDAADAYSAFAAPVRPLADLRRRRCASALVAARRPGALKAPWLSQEASHPSKRRGASVVSLLAGKPVSERGPFLRTVAKVLACSLAAGAGLIVLLYITSAFEAWMELTSGAVKGKTPLVAGVIGLAVGALHTFAGPDHLAGLAPLVIGQGRSLLAAFGLGALWGSGHATGQLLLGLATMLVQFGILRMSWAGAFSQASTFLIGGSLIAIGLLGLNETRNFSADFAVGDAPVKRRFGWATYFTGVLHGLSLDAILFISPALALPRLAAGLHIVGVSIGTLLSMGVYTALLSRLCQSGPRLQLVSGGASVVAMMLGAVILLASLGLNLGLPGL